MKLSDYVSGPWLDFSSQNNLRSLPSIKDGLIVTNRKLLHSLKGTKSFDTVERYGLKAASDTQYKHGGTSICNSLAIMAKDFAGTNNVPLFQKDGQFGTSIDPEASEVRYISTKISDNFRDWFSKEDDDILPLRIQRGEFLEPMWYAPIAPIALVNGAFGIGSGFSSNIRGHNPLDVVNSVLEYAREGEILTELKPWWKGWKGTVKRDTSNENRFFVTGSFKRVDTSTIIITEMPPSMNSNKFCDKVTAVLLENDDNVISIDDDSNESDGWNITVKFKRGQAAKLSDSDIHKMFMMVESMSHVLWAWGLDDKITNFRNINHIVEEWTIWRVSVYENRRRYQITDLNEKLTYERMKLEVVGALINSPKAFDESLVTRVVESYGYGKTEINSMLNIPIRNVTIEGIDKINASIKSLKERLSLLTDQTAEDIMFSELEGLKAKLIKDGSFGTK